MSFEQTLEKYAALAVNVGVNIQPGQTLSISAPLEAVQFVRLVTEKAYKSGAKHVYSPLRSSQYYKAYPPRHNRLSSSRAYL